MFFSQQGNSFKRISIARLSGVLFFCLAILPCGAETEFDFAGKVTGAVNGEYSFDPEGNNAYVATSPGTEINVTANDGPVSGRLSLELNAENPYDSVILSELALAYQQQNMLLELGTLGSVSQQVGHGLSDIQLSNIDSTIHGFNITDVQDSSIQLKVQSRALTWMLSSQMDASQAQSAVDQIELGVKAESGAMRLGLSYATMDPFNDDPIAVYGGAVSLDGEKADINLSVLQGDYFSVRGALGYELEHSYLALIYEYLSDNLSTLSIYSSEYRTGLTDTFDLFLNGRYLDQNEQSIDASVGFVWELK
jgi:hypothetical protein